MTVGESSRGWGRFGLRWFEPAPARRLGLLRVLIGGFALGYVAVRLPHLISFGGFSEERFDPVGYHETFRTGLGRLHLADPAPGRFPLVTLRPPEDGQIVLQVEAGP